MNDRGPATINLRIKSINQTHQFVFGEVPNGLADTAGDHVRGHSEEDGATGVLGVLVQVLVDELLEYPGKHRKAIELDDNHANAENATKPVLAMIRS